MEDRAIHLESRIILLPTGGMEALAQAPHCKSVTCLAISHPVIETNLDPNLQKKHENLETADMRSLKADSSPL